MTVLMVVTMTITDPAWIEPYFAAVPAILEDYGATSVAGSRSITRIEGEADVVPDRVAILSFPSLEAVTAFMADERYQPFRAARHQGSVAEILIFENAVSGAELC